MPDSRPTLVWNPTVISTIHHIITSCTPHPHPMSAGVLAMMVVMDSGDHPLITSTLSPSPSPTLDRDRHQNNCRPQKWTIAKLQATKQQYEEVATMIVMVTKNLNGHGYNDSHYGRIQFIPHSNNTKGNLKFKCD